MERTGGEKVFRGEPPAECVAPPPPRTGVGGYRTRLDFSVQGNRRGPAWLLPLLQHRIKNRESVGAILGFEEDSSNSGGHSE